MELEKPHSCTKAWQLDVLDSKTWGGSRLKCGRSLRAEGTLQTPFSDLQGLWTLVISTAHYMRCIDGTMHIYIYTYTYMHECRVPYLCPKCFPNTIYLLLYTINFSKYFTLNSLTKRSKQKHNQNYYTNKHPTS